MPRITLKYLFEAQMKDGSIIQQTHDDISAVDPLRSAYYDVAQRLDDVKLFGLYNDDHTYVVSLEDGHFEIDGVPFSAQPVTRPCINEGGQFRLVYFRDHQQEFVISAIVGDGRQIIDTHDIGPHYHQYRMGWQYTDPNGSVYEQTIVIV